MSKAIDEPLPSQPILVRSDLCHAPRLPLLYALRKNQEDRGGLLVTALEEFLQWCARELIKLRTQLRQYESGNMTLQQRSAGAAWVDRTDQEIVRLKKNIADLEAVVKRLKN
jgi:hypothetical protein